jgi:hypothetical protein
MDTCVCCGWAVPEGRMVCPECEIESFERSIKNVDEIKADVKSIKALPGSRWEAVVKGVITAILAGLIGFALARLGMGG